MASSCDLQFDDKRGLWSIFKFLSPLVHEVIHAVLVLRFFAGNFKTEPFPACTFNGQVWQCVICFLRIRSGRWSTGNNAAGSAEFYSKHRVGELLCLSIFYTLAFAGYRKLSSTGQRSRNIIMNAADLHGISRQSH